LSVNEEESEDKEESLDRETREAREAREARPKDIGAPSPEDQPIPGYRSFKTACIAAV
jgi:hypothetical protein